MSTSNGSLVEGYNPKKDTGVPNGRSFQVFNSLKNPIPDEVADAAEIRKFFEKYRFVPYAGTNEHSGHSLLAFYKMLYKMSPTHGSCIRKKSDFAFGSRPTAIPWYDMDFDTGDEVAELGPGQKATYAQALKDHISFGTPVRDLCRVLSNHYQSTGNCWLYVRVAKVLGVVRAQFSYVKPENVLYVNEEGPMMVAISPIWDDEYLRKNPPEIVPVSSNDSTVEPTFAKNGDGSFSTIFQVKSGDNHWYGRPPSENGVLSQFSEVQNVLYRVRSTYGEYTGKIIIETEEEDPKRAFDDLDEDAREAGFKNHVHRFEQNFTQKSDDPQQVFVTMRPFGSRPMFVFSVPPNTSHEYFKAVKEMDEHDILLSNQCTMRFMSFEVASGFSNDIFISDYVLNMEPVIMDLRQTILSVVNRAISIVWKMAGVVDMDKMSLGFHSPIQNDIQSYKEGKQINKDIQAQTLQNMQAPPTSQQQPQLDPRKKK